MKKALIFIPLILFVGMLGIFILNLDKDPRIIPSQLMNKPVPKILLEGLYAGENLDTSAWMEGPYLINVFASWCVPCVAEHPLLMYLSKEKKVPIYGLAYKDHREKIETWLQQRGNPFLNIGMDPSGKAALDLGVYGVPETFLVNKHGLIIYRHIGPLTPEVIADTILPLFNRNDEN